MGVLAGMAGLEHGIGEILQGNRAPDGIMFPSWPGSAFFQIVAGEPAMSIIPNLVVSGMLTMLFSLIFIIWACLFAQRKNGSLVLILLSIIMLLVGGGFGPPLLGIIIGAAATQMHEPLSGWPTHISTEFQNITTRLWPWFLGACVMAWLLLFPGLSILGYFFGVNRPNLIPVLFFLALGLLLLTIFSGFVRDCDSTSRVFDDRTKGEIYSTRMNENDGSS
jgi:hypothetical protein